MPKIIFTSRYLRDAPPEQLGNYVKYIGTREGVEKIDESKGHLPATAAQKKLIAQLLRDLPKARAMLEYEDYRFIQPDETPLNLFPRPWNGIWICCRNGKTMWTIWPTVPMWSGSESMDCSQMQGSRW